MFYNFSRNELIVYIFFNIYVRIYFNSISRNFLNMVRLYVRGNHQFRSELYELITFIFDERMKRITFTFFQKYYCYQLIYKGTSLIN
jgi:hypothetical protein